MSRLYDIDPVKPSTTVHYDWLSVTFPFRQPNTVDDWLHRLGLDSLGPGDPLANGLYTYNKALTWSNGIIIAWSDDRSNNNGNTILLQMSGQGIEVLESLLANNHKTVAEWVREVFDGLQGKVTRIDACTNFFNYGKELSARYLNEQAEQGNLITKARTVKYMTWYDSKGRKPKSDKFDPYTGHEEGATLYVGNNPKQLRIYNKLAERYDKVGFVYDLKSWSRWEFQLNGQVAEDFVDMLRSFNYDLVKTWKSWLKSNYRFIERVGYQAKRTRYPNATWFDDIIKGGLKLTIRREKQKPTLAKAEKWVQTQVMPTLTNLYLTKLGKYEANGMEFNDAERLANEDILTQIQFTILDGRYSDQLVNSWLVEHKNNKRGLIL